MSKRRQAVPKGRKSKADLLARLRSAGAANSPAVAQAQGRISDPALLELLAVAQGLFRRGQLQEAFDAYSRIARLAPAHRGTHLSLSAILMSAGKKEEGLASLRRYFATYPLESTISPAVRPVVMKIRGLDRTRPMVGKSTDGSYKPRLRGGHFTTQYLLMNPDFPVNTFTISNDNINQPDFLPPFDLLLNTISEPDIEATSLRSLEKYVEAHPDIPVINRPERVWMTSRDRNFERLEGASQVTFPETRRVSFEKATTEEVLRQVASLGVQTPFIIREAGTQTGRTTQLVETVFDLEKYASNGLDGDYFVIAYREILWRKKYFRKLRLFHIDGEFYPVVCHLDQIWNVHGFNRKEIMRNDERLMAEEKAFLKDWRSYVGPGNADNLYWLGEVTGLEFFGVDFTVDEDNKIFIYETNAAMRHSFDHAANFPYKLEPDLATSAAFMRMVRSRLPANWAGHRNPDPKPTSPIQGPPQ